MAIRAGEVVALLTLMEGECEVLSSLGHSTAKHCRVSHRHSDVSRACEVTERCLVVFSWNSEFFMISVFMYVGEKEKKIG